VIIIGSKKKTKVERKRKVKGRTFQKKKMFVLLLLLILIPTSIAYYDSAWNLISTVAGAIPFWINGTLYPQPNTTTGLTNNQNFITSWLVNATGKGIYRIRILSNTTNPNVADNISSYTEIEIFSKDIIHNNTYIVEDDMGSSNSGCSNAYDMDWNTYCSGTGTINVYENYTIPKPLTNANLTYKYETADSLILQIFCWNYSSGDWTRFVNSNTGGTLIVVIPLDCYINQDKYLQKVIIPPSAFAIGRFYEDKVTWNGTRLYGDPFYMDSGDTTNPKACVGLTAGQSCSFASKLYAIGAYGNYSIYFFSNGTNPNIVRNDSSSQIVEITQETATCNISLNYSNVEFSSIAHNTTNNPAQNNYSVSANTTSLCNGYLTWSIPSPILTYLSYTIANNNLKLNYTLNTQGNSTLNLRDANVIVTVGTSAQSKIYPQYWLDVPNQQHTGDYQGQEVISCGCP